MRWWPKFDKGWEQTNTQTNKWCWIGRRTCRLCVDINRSTRATHLSPANENTPDWYLKWKPKPISSDPSKLKCVCVCVRKWFPIAKQLWLMIFGIREKNSQFVAKQSHFSFSKESNKPARRKQGDQHTPHKTATLVSTVMKPREMWSDGRLSSDQIVFFSCPEEVCGCLLFRRSAPKGKKAFKSIWTVGGKQERKRERERTIGFSSFHILFTTSFKWQPKWGSSKCEGYRFNERRPGKSGDDLNGDDHT